MPTPPITSLSEQSPLFEAPEESTGSFEAYGAITSISKASSRADETQLAGRVSLQPRSRATNFLLNKIDSARDISLFKRYVATKGIEHVLPRLTWLEKEDSFNALVETTVRSTSDFISTLNHTSVQDAEKWMLAMQGESKESEMRQHYQDSIARRLGYEGLKDLKSQSLRSVSRKSGGFVSQDEGASWLKRVFNKIYRSLFGAITKHLVKSNISKVGKLLPKIDDENLPVYEAQSDVFTYYMLHQLMEKQPNIIEGQASAEVDMSDIHDHVVRWLQPQLGDDDN